MQFYKLLGYDTYHVKPLLSGGMVGKTVRAILSKTLPTLQRLAVITSVMSGDHACFINATFALMLSTSKLDQRLLLLLLLITLRLMLQILLYGPGENHVGFRTPLPADFLLQLDSEWLNLKSFMLQKLQ